MKKLTLFLVAAFVCTSTVFAAKPFRAVVTKTRGKAFVKLDEGQQWKKCYTAMVLDENATVKTNRWSKVEIMLSDRSKIKMKGNSQLKLNNLSDQDKEVEQQKGRSIFKIAKFDMIASGVLSILIPTLSWASMPILIRLLPSLLTIFWSSI